MLHDGATSDIRVFLLLNAPLQLWQVHRSRLCSFFSITSAYIQNLKRRRYLVLSLFSAIPFATTPHGPVHASFRMF